MSGMADICWHTQALLQVHGRKKRWLLATSLKKHNSKQTVSVENVSSLNNNPHKHPEQQTKSKNALGIDQIEIVGVPDRVHGWVYAGTASTNGTLSYGPKQN